MSQFEKLAGLKDWWNSVGDEGTRDTIMKALMTGGGGALAGGTLLGGLRAAGPAEPGEDKKTRRKAIINRAMLGALLGSTAGAVPVAQHILRGAYPPPSFGDKYLTPSGHEIVATGVGGTTAGLAGRVGYGHAKNMTPSTLGGTSLAQLGELDPAHPAPSVAGAYKDLADARTEYMKYHDVTGKPISPNPPSAWMKAPDMDAIPREAAKKRLLEIMQQYTDPETKARYWSPSKARKFTAAGGAAGFVGSELATRTIGQKLMKYLGLSN